MNILILDESKKREREMENLLRTKGHTVTVCAGSGEFIEYISTERPDKIFIDVESWHHGRAIYNYFKIQKKLEAFDIVFYNAPNYYKGLAERSAHPQDKIYPKEKPVDLLINENA